MRALPAAHSLLLALFLLPGAVSAQGSNRLVDPGFEAGNLAAWNVVGNAYREAAAPPRFVPRSGAGLASLFGNFSGGVNETRLFQETAASPGERWLLSASARHFSGDALGGSGPPAGNALFLRLGFHDAGGAELARMQSVALDGRAPTDVWRGAGPLAGVAPAGTVRVRASLVFRQPALAPGAAHVDDVRLELGAGGVPRVPLASRIGAHGGLEVREVRPDGTRAPWSPFVIRGLDVGWTPVGQFPWTTLPPLADPAFLPLLDRFARTGVNLLRFYYLPGTQGDPHVAATRAALDRCHRLGLKVLLTLDAGRIAGAAGRADLDQALASLGDHPAVFGFSIGNEWNLGLDRGTALARADEVQRIAAHLRAADPDRIVVTSIVISPDHDLLRGSPPLVAEMIARMPDVDLHGINHYRTGSLHPLCALWERATGGAPAAIFEFGVDSYDFTAGRRDLAVQAEDTERHLAEVRRIRSEGSIRPWFAGMVVFAAVDEWWKNPLANNSPAVQEPDGYWTNLRHVAPSASGVELVYRADPDGHRSEEHFGLWELPGLVAKPVHQAVRAQFRAERLGPTRTEFRLVGCGRLGGGGGLDEGFYALQIEGNTAWHAVGSEGARGLTVMRFDPRTGDLADLRSFDVYGALLSGGTALTEAVAHIDGLPSGSYAGLVVADSLLPAGSAPGAIAPLSQAIVRRFGARRLGAGIPFRAAWALIGRAGATRPLAESGPTVGAPVAVQATIAFDRDADGIPDLLDPDDDGDGVGDADEVSRGSDPLAPGERPFALRLEMDAARRVVLFVDVGDAPGASLAAVDLSSLSFELLGSGRTDLASWLFNGEFVGTPRPAGGLELRSRRSVPSLPSERLAIRVLDSSGRLHAAVLPLR